VKFTITLRNDTETPLYNIAVWDSLPPEVMFVGTDFIDAPLIQDGNYIAWDISYKTGYTDPFILEPGQEETITFSVKIIASSPATGPIMLVAETDYADGYFFPGSPYGDKHYPPVSSEQFFYPLGKIVIYPNPYNPEKGSLNFNNVVPGSTIQIWTVSGEHVRTIFSPGIRAFWDGRNHAGHPVSQGIYFFTVRNGSSNVALKGKIFVIKE